MEDLFNIGDPSGLYINDIHSDPIFTPLDDSNNIMSEYHLLDKTDPFSSGFDEEHPMLSYEELRNAGFPGSVAADIIYNSSHDYSQRELFHCLYESDNPYEAYQELERQKMRELIFRTDQNIKDAEDLLRRLPY